jgi:hypothetical protein
MRHHATSIGELKTQQSDPLKKRPLRPHGVLIHELLIVGTDLSPQESQALLDLFALLDEWDHERGFNGN